MWIWSKLSALKWLDAWEERFYGNPNTVINEIKGGKSIRVEVYCETEAEGESIVAQFGGSLRELKSKNWVALSAPKVKPILIRNTLIISQSDSKEERQTLENKYPGRPIIFIPAEMAFGTGDHPTTSTCLRFLSDVAQKQEPGWSFLDLGTGSGVLAIAAKLLHAGDVKAFDFDPKAVEVAAENLTRNGVSGIDVFEEDVFKWKNSQKFQIVAANLFSSVLLEALPLMQKWVQPGGRLILSGILHEQWPDVLAKAEECQFLPLEHRKRGKWVTATFDAPE